MVAFVDEHRRQWPVAVMCTTIGLPERSYYAVKARAPSARSRSDAVHRIHIRRVWENNYRCYGARRVHKALRREGYVIARCTVARLMADLGIRGVQRGKTRYTTVPDVTAARPPDLVGRRFVADRPNQLWLADITYASTWQGWLYVSFILDVYSRAIVGWQIADHVRTDLVLDALEMAIWRRDLAAGGLVHHSDAGSQGGINRSSQHLDQEVCDGTTGGVDGHTDGKACDAIAGQATDSSRCRAGVLAEDRRGADQRGRGARVRRVRAGRVAVVPRPWRHGFDPADPVLGQVPVVRRARGDRTTAGPGHRGARDRSTIGA